MDVTFENLNANLAAVSDVVTAKASLSDALSSDIRPKPDARAAWAVNIRSQGRWQQLYTYQDPDARYRGLFDTSSNMAMEKQSGDVLPHSAH